MDLPTLNSSPPALSRLPGGRLVCSWGYRLPDDGSGPTAIQARTSDDNGQTWKQPGAWRSGKTKLRPGGSGPCIAGIHAPLVQLADGCLMAMGRFDDVADQERFGFKMPVSYSSDLGETWSYEASEFQTVGGSYVPKNSAISVRPSGFH